MDSTHGTNVYDFMLVSILVVDSYGEGLPVAWALTNHEDTTVLVEFLRELKTRTGNINPEIFMSDDAQQFYNAWCMVYGGSSSKLLCMWHVDRSWRKSLNEHVEDSQSRIEIYHQLRVLLLEQNKAEFHLQLQRFMSHLHENYFRYYEYFKRIYAGRCEQWATCYRTGCIANTNMFTESFHRLLKVVYLDGKHNRRVDTLLNTLLRIAKNLVYEQITKEEKGKLSHRQCEIRKRHKKAIEMLDNFTAIKVPDTDSEWKVESATKQDTVYTIHQLCTGCSCKLGCLSCGACSHMYSCSCIDYALHSTVCKHIHLVKMHTSGGDNQMSDPLAEQDNPSHSADNSSVSTATVEVKETPFNSTEHFASVLNTERQFKNIERTKLDINSLMQQLKTNVEGCLSQEQLNVVKKHLQSAVSSMEAYNHYHTAQCNSTFNQTSNPPPNACNKKQLRFFSTKRKRNCTASKMKKPSHEEQKSASQSLQAMDVTVCAICWKEEDENNTEEDILWISCSKCELWMHTSCLKSDVIDPDGYLCESCNC